MVIAKFSSYTTACFRSMQGRRVTVSAQRADIIDLREALIYFVSWKEQMSLEEFAALDQWIQISSNSLTVLNERLWELILDQSLFAVEKLAGLGDYELTEFTQDLKGCLLKQWMVLIQSGSNVIKPMRRSTCNHWSFFVLADEISSTDTRNAVELWVCIKTGFWSPRHQLRLICSSRNTKKCSVLLCRSRYWKMLLNRPTTSRHSMIVGRVWTGVY